MRVLKRARRQISTPRLFRTATELFFQSPRHGRIAGPMQRLAFAATQPGIVPEPELAVVFNAYGEIAGYTLLTM